MTWQYQSNRQVPGNWKRLRIAVFQRDGDTCHMCGHNGADEIDHVMSVGAWVRNKIEGNPHDLANLAPIHSERCITCGQRCHKDKTQAEARAARPNRKRTMERHPGLTG